MSCYLRHVREIMKEVGVEVTSENKKAIDEVIHKTVGVKYKNCPGAWKGVKKRITTENEKREFAREIKKQIK